VTIQEECKRCLRCDLEWLETMGLAHVPVSEQILVAKEPVLPVSSAGEGAAGQGRDA
jgi:hypothetical protein